MTRKKPRGSPDILAVCSPPPEWCEKLIRRVLVGKIPQHVGRIDAFGLDVYADETVPKDIAYVLDSSTAVGFEADGTEYVKSLFSIPEPTLHQRLGDLL